MATSSPSPSPSRKHTATSSRSFKSNSKSDWLGPTLLAVKTITAGTESVPYVRRAFGMIVILLETVEKVRKNRDDLKELCENSIEIMKIIQDQILSHGPTVAEKLKSVCEEFESTLQEIIGEVKEWQDVPRGLRGHFKEMVKSSSISNRISEYQNKVQTLCLNLKLIAAIDTNFEVYKIHASLKTIAPNSDLSITQETQSINNCPPPSRIFHGRQTILSKMHQDFTEDQGRQRIYVLYGLGGSGKTQIALKFIDESASKFSDIFLIDMSTPETTDTGLKSIAVTKKIGDSIQDALDWLRSKKNEWLLFFDNADDPKIDLHHFFPCCKHGNILITSRNPQLRGYGSHSHVSDMEETDAVELLLRSAAQDLTPKNKDTATKIVKALWYLPLAIVQAGAFILKSGSLNSYLALYMKNKEQLLREKPSQSHDNYAWTVYTTWQISFDQLSPPAAMLLQLCSFIHHGGISEEFFSNASDYRFPSSGPSREELKVPWEFLSQFFRPDNTWNSLCFCNVTNELQAYSLITFDVERNVFSIHPLVHTSCMTAIGGMSINEISDEDILLASLTLLPHVSSLLHGELHMTPDFEAQYGRLFYYTGKYKEAAKLLVRRVEKQRQLDNSEDADTLLVKKILALTYESLGQSNDARELQTKVLDNQKKLLGDNHPHTLGTMNDLAWTYHSLGRFQEAAELQRVALEKCRQLFGANHLQTLDAMNNLAWMHLSLDQFKAAEAIQITVLQKRKEIQGDDHPDTLIATSNLGLIYGALGQLKKAKGLIGWTAFSRRMPLPSACHISHHVPEFSRRTLGADG
ncbi:P-loop containing nucleoside triphosphate hydrolase protein [Mycena latifolia]|nr:P-loop containing nucleoside triphosphate hydrolase protein [Mycena latifolia]